jgi:hypothetical protein
MLKLESKDALSITISFAALCFSLVSFFYARIQEWRASRTSVIKALQGEKEAVAYVAYQVETGRWDERLKKSKFRKDLITALCLAFAVEGADRAKALVFAALHHLKGLNYSNEIAPVLLALHNHFVVYKKDVNPSDFDKRVRSIEAVLKSLGIEIPSSSPSDSTA